MLITRDAQEHLDRVLAAAAACCAEIVVLDSGSRDATEAIARAHGARFHVRDFDGYGTQKRAAVALARNDWILALDADEVLDDAAIAAVRALRLPEQGTACWYLRRRTFIGTREIRHGLWRNDRVLRLFDRRETDFTPEPVHESVPPVGRAAVLPGGVQHYSFPDLAAVFSQRYMRLKAQRYRARGRRAGPVLLLLRAWWAFVRSYILRRGFLDGGYGVAIALHAATDAVVALAMASAPVAGDGPES
ncbi:MAG: glycosyltransferase family 2 protein [Planctomycetota bacterium]